MASVVITPSADSYAYLGRAIEQFNGPEQFRYDPGWHQVNGSGSGLTTVRWTWEGAEIALDVIGSSEIPILSQLADLGAAAIAYGRGDNVGAGLSTLATFPVMGELANGLKWARRIGKTVNLPSWKKMSFLTDPDGKIHILTGHVKGGQRTVGGRRVYFRTG